MGGTFSRRQGDGAGRKAAHRRGRKAIRYVNGRYKLCGEPESRWLYNIRYTGEGETLLLTEQEVRNQLKRLEDMGLVKVGTGRAGSRLTPEGVVLLSGGI